MKVPRYLILSTAVILSLTSVKALAYEPTPKSLEVHVKLLASDSLEGREVGSEGASKAARYLVSQFEAMGLKPYGADGSYLEPFEFTKEIAIGDNNSLSINNKQLEVKVDYEPLKNSANGHFQLAEIVPVGFGITIDSGNYDDYATLDVTGKGVLVTRFSPSEEAYPHTDFRPYEGLLDKIDNAIRHQAAALFFVTPDGEADSVAVGGFANITAREIPIFWLKRAGLEKLGLKYNTKEILTAEGSVNMIRVKDTAYNVLAFLPGESDTTICIGAHYDHLGWGNEASLYRGNTPMIHHGADDNGSGVAAMIEIARTYAERQEPAQYSKLFIAFTGEERGLLGSSHYAKEVLQEPKTIRMMMNIDMVGRLQEQDNGLAILGTGTCAEFKSYFASLPDPGVKLTFKEDGIGPSDHTPFYNREIPVLFFFTGAHEDYHRPSDTWEKLDYPGLTKVCSIVTGIVDHFDTYPNPLTFQTVKVSEAASGGRRRFSVSLGVMPDYVAEVRGLKIDALSPGKVAEKGGLMAGDIIIKMGDYDVTDIYSYMNCLNKFKKGETVPIMVERATDTLSLEVTFE